MRWISLLLLVSTLACTDSEQEHRESIRPEPPAQSAPEAPRASNPEATPPSPAGDETGTAAEGGDAPGDVEDEPIPAPAPSRWLGRWEASTRDGVCIELRANGRFELTSRNRRRGDVVVTGRYTLDEEAPDGIEVTLRPRNVHQERYVTACRRHVFPDQDLPSFRILGLDFRRGGEFVLSLRERDDGTPELCAGDRCQPLQRRT